VTAVRAVDLGGREALNLDPGRKDSVLLLLVGPMIGQGVYREVYEVRGRPDVVLKVEVAGTEFCNATEWNIWRRVADTPFAKWFAPCLAIDQGGGALLQKRTKPMSDTAWRKLKVPAFFTDMKADNWGLIGGQPVCHDYALNRIIERGVTGKRMIGATD
jgi:hypothetical protein